MAAYPLNDREHATVLAALRFWQRHHGGRATNDWQFDEGDVATNRGTLEPLTGSEIDDLCFNLNTAKDD